MKFTLGFLTGFGTAWAALAIWQHRVTEKWDRELDDIAIPPADEDDLDGIVYDGVIFDTGTLAHLMPQGARDIPPTIHKFSFRTVENYGTEEVVAAAAKCLMGGEILLRVESLGQPGMWTAWAQDAS